MERRVLVIGSSKFKDDIQNALSTLGLDIVGESDIKKIKNRCRAKPRHVDIIIFDDDTYRSKGQGVRLNIIAAIRECKKDFIIVSSRTFPSAVWEAKKLGAADYIVKPYNYREFIARFNAVVQEKKRITCIGGGTGLFHLLLGLKQLPRVMLTSVVSVGDDGGSSGRLRASFGILPPGDVRRSLVALSNAPETMNEVMQYRFSRGDGISGHNLGNLFLAAISDIKGSLPEGVRAVSDILNVSGIVLPITNTVATLCALFEDGTVIKGENRIDLAKGRDPNLHINEFWHEPETECNIDAFSSIMNSDFVTIGPGDLYTSVITNLLVRNIREALAETKAKVVYICNLMTKPGETAKYGAFDHVKEIIKYMGGDYLDYVIISNTKLSSQSVGTYAKKQQFPVAIGNLKQIQSITQAKIILADVGHKEELVRHDSVKIRNEIRNILRRKTAR